MILISDEFDLTNSAVATADGFSQDDVDWYSLNLGAQVTDDYGNAENFPGPFTTRRPRIGWNNRIDSASLAATSEHEDYPVAHVSHASTAITWQTAEGDEATAQAMYFSTEAGGACDYMAFAAHNLGSLGVGLSLQCRETATDVMDVDDDAGWTTVFLSQGLANDDAFFYQFAPTVNRYWRLRLTPPDTNTTPLALAVLYVGRALIMPRNLYVGHTPLTYGRVTQKAVNTSESGQYLGQVITSTKLHSKFEFTHIGPIFYRRWIDPWVQHARSKPFFWAWYPDKYPEECGLAWCSNDMTPVNQRANGMMSLSGHLEGFTP